MKTMKKVLALVLALTMVFAFGSAVSAKEIAAGQIYCGPEDVTYANPGETIKTPIQFVADVFESDGYPADGTLHVPLIVLTGDVELAPIVSVELTEEAKAAGVSFSEGTEFLEPNAVFNGEVILPSSYLHGSKSITLFTVEIAVSEKWEVIDNATTQEISAEFYAGNPAKVGSAYIETADGETITVKDIGNEDIRIAPRPYEPTIKDKIVEFIKEKLLLVVDALIMGLEQLKKLLTK